jgi:TetR/AcrR family transcriptional repressor of nem operon
MTDDGKSVRRHILDVAKGIILQKGFSAAGLTEILTAADVPKGSFYHYFKSKEAFGEALLDVYFSEYLANLEALLTQPGRPAADRLMSYWDRWTQTQVCQDPDGRCLAVKLGSEVCDLSEAMRLALVTGMDHIIARLAACIRAGAKDGSLPADLDADHTAQTLYEIWLGATLLAKIRRDPTSLDGALAATRQWLRQPDRAEGERE